MSFPSQFSQWCWNPSKQEMATPPCPHVQQTPLMLKHSLEPRTRTAQNSLLYSIALDHDKLQCVRLGKQSYQLPYNHFQVILTSIWIRSDNNIDFFCVICENYVMRMSVWMSVMISWGNGTLAEISTIILNRPFWRPHRCVRSIFLLFKCAKNSPSAAVIQIGKNEEMSELTLNQSRTAGESGKTTFIAHFSTDIWRVLVEPYHWTFKEGENAKD